MATQWELDTTQLLGNIKTALPVLKEMLVGLADKWQTEEHFYRFYHQSFKVFYVQRETLRIVDALRALSPDRPLNAWFLGLVEAGTGKEFDRSTTNANWLAETRPLIEAFFHAKQFLELVVKYGAELEEAPSFMPSGWAAVLYLYNLR